MSDDKNPTAQAVATETRELLPHQQRVVDEVKDVSARLVRLDVFMRQPAFRELPDAEQNLLAKQGDILEALQGVLHDRIRLWAAADQICGPLNLTPDMQAPTVGMPGGPACKLDDGALLSWLEAQGEVHMKEWYRPSRRGGKSERYLELTDSDDEVMGEGPDLRAAILDAIGGVR